MTRTSGYRRRRSTAAGGDGVSAGEEVRAAGAVPWRRREDGGVELAVVHRPRYDDWSFPKGKLEVGESFAEGALRELAEETGLAGELGASLPEHRYVDHLRRPKVVQWWLLEVRGEASGGAVPNDEVDDLRWLSPGDAAALVTYEHDRTLAHLAAGLLGT